ncbi:MAG: ferrous iron transport protein A [Candidatus Ruthia sp.]|jgi:Fe2+ transport system protein FeoA|nr:ferrous iron transport protein A [Candidatus Ruthturnera sp.]MBT4182131.1 ferrous iron transport protein A [Candidatus Thioglobus sp.]MBT4668841.1 ferrous iron transport protein A [Candidatus Ruthturnera sp.]MBT6922441.1 ferrous iron transport protein A [Candidatus Ruthturnera sp.]
MKLLSSLEINNQVMVEKINATHEKKIKLLGLGISTGVLLSILRNRGGDMVVSMGNARVSIGRTLAKFIEVREL